MMNEKGITIVCREYGKCKNRRAVTYIVKRDASARDIRNCSLRSIYNPELEYYASTIDGDDDYIIAMTRVKGFKEPFFARI